MIVKKTGRVIGALLCLPFLGLAQKFEELEKKYPGEQAVILSASENYKISMVDGKPYVESSDNTRILFLSSSPASYVSRHSFFHSSFHDLKSCAAYTETANNKKIKVSEFKTYNSHSSGIFYDDIKETSFYFPGVSAGAIGNLDLLYTHKNFFLMSPYYFKRGIPVLSNKLVVSFPDKVSLKYVLKGNDTSLVKFSQTSRKGTTVYSFETTDLPAEKYYEDAPGRAYFSAHVVFYIEKYINDAGETVKCLGNIDDLYAFNYSFIKGINHKPDSAVTRLVHDLTKDAPTQLDKAKNIYKWVQGNIKYVAFEDGMGGFVPREGNMVCNRKYGDCKDMASILTLMLNTAGVPAYFTWIGTRSLPYRYSDVPSPVVDNHMIAAIKDDNGNFIFLDGTDPHCVFGVPPHSIQDKEALIAINENEYKLVRVPVIDKDKNQVIDSTFIHLTDKGVAGSIKIGLKGYFATDTRSHIQYTAVKDIEKYMRNMMIRGSNKFLLNKYNIVDSSDVAVTGAFTLEDYARKIGDEWYVNLNLMKLYDHQEIDYPKRKMPVEFDYKFRKKYVTILEIPEGYKVSDLPKGKSFNNNTWGFSINYTLTANQLILTQEFDNDHLLLHPGDFEAWNDVLKYLLPLYKETITLSKK